MTSSRAWVVGVFAISDSSGMAISFLHEANSRSPKLICLLVVLWWPLLVRQNCFDKRKSKSSTKNYVGLLCIIYVNEKEGNACSCLELWLLTEVHRPESIWRGRQMLKLRRSKECSSHLVRSSVTWIDLFTPQKSCHHSNPDVEKAYDFPKKSLWLFGETHLFSLRKSRSSLLAGSLRLLDATRRWLGTFSLFFYRNKVGYSAFFWVKRSKEGH